MDLRERNRRRRYGQNDLVDPRARERIADAIETAGPLAGAGVLEIGAGEGTLTRTLLARGPALLVALEIDPEREQRLREAPADPALRIRGGDAARPEVLQEALAELPSPRRVVGSLPYNVSTAIVDAILDNAFHDAHVIVQLEVAERLVAAPGSRAYGYLAVLAQLRATPTLIARVPRSAFHPRPNVESALVRLVPRPSPVGDSARFRGYLSRAFGMRRKMLRNALGDPGAAAALARAGLDPDVRAEALAPLEHVALEAALADGGGGTPRSRDVER